MAWVIVAAVVGFIVGAVLTWGYMVNSMDNMEPPTVVEPEFTTETSFNATVTGYRYNPVSRRVEKR